MGTTYKRLTALLLTVCLLFPMLPLQAAALDDDTPIPPAADSAPEGSPADVSPEPEEVPPDSAQSPEIPETPDTPVVEEETPETPVVEDETPETPVVEPEPETDTPETPETPVVEPEPEPEPETPDTPVVEPEPADSPEELPPLEPVITEPVAEPTPAQNSQATTSTAEARIGSDLVSDPDGIVKAIKNADSSYYHPFYWPYVEDATDCVKPMEGVPHAYWQQNYIWYYYNWPSDPPIPVAWEVDSDNSYTTLTGGSADGRVAYKTPISNQDMTAAAFGIVVDGSAKISFDYLVSCEDIDPSTGTVCDDLAVMLNDKSATEDNVLFTYSYFSNPSTIGTGDACADIVFRGYGTSQTQWKTFEFDVEGAGLHAITWMYEKDSGGSSGQDTAWLSNIVVTKNNGKTTLPTSIQVEYTKDGQTQTATLSDNTTIDADKGTQVNVTLSGLNSDFAYSVSENGTKTAITEGTTSYTINEDTLLVVAAEKTGYSTAKRNIKIRAIQKFKESDFKLPNGFSVNSSVSDWVFDQSGRIPYPAYHSFYQEYHRSVLEWDVTVDEDTFLLLDTAHSLNRSSPFYIKLDDEKNNWSQKEGITSTDTRFRYTSKYYNVYENLTDENQLIWETHAVPLSKGTHKVRLEYMDNGYPKGLHSAWVANPRLSPTYTETPVIEITDSENVLDHMYVMNDPGYPWMYYPDGGFYWFQNAYSEGGLGSSINHYTMKLDLNSDSNLKFKYFISHQKPSCATMTITTDGESKEFHPTKTMTYDGVSWEDYFITLKAGTHIIDFGYAVIDPNLDNTTNQSYAYFKDFALEKNIAYGQLTVNYDEKNGTVTKDGEKVAPGTVLTGQVGTGVTLEAAATQPAFFRKWTNNYNADNYTTSYQATFSDTPQTVTAVFSTNELIDVAGYTQGTDGIKAQTREGYPWTYTNGAFTSDPVGSESIKSELNLTVTGPGIFRATRQSLNDSSLMFGYTIDDGKSQTSMTIGTTPSDFDINLSEGEHTISLFCKKSSSTAGNNSAVLSNIQLQQGNETVTAVSSDEAYGTVSGGGEYSYGATVNLVATPKDGGEFYGWAKRDSADSQYKLISGQEISFQIEKGGYYDYKAIFAATGSKEAHIDSVFYSTLPEAIAAAKAGDTVFLLKDVTISNDFTIPTGVTVVIPCQAGDTGYQNGFNYDGTETSPNVGVSPREKVYRTLTVSPGATFTINGTVLVNSISGRPVTGNGTEYVITGGYGKIALDGNIVINSGGVLDNFGYIKGNGLITVKNGGTVSDLYTVRHWRGGSQASAMYFSDIYPMNEYDCHNIENNIVIESGGSFAGLVKIYAGSSYSTARFPQVDNENGLVRLSSGATLTRSYQDGCETYAITGGGTFASSTLNVAGLNLSTGGYLYPIDGDIIFQLAKGDYHFVNDYKFLTGAKVEVAKDATLTVDEGKRVVFYDAFTDSSAFAGSATSNDTRYPERPAAQLLLNGGTFTNKGTFAGQLTATAANATVNLAEGSTLTIDTQEAKSLTGFLQTPQLRDFNFKAALVGSSGTAADAAAGTYQSYANGSGYDWGTKVGITFDANADTDSDSITVPGAITQYPSTALTAPDTSGMKRVGYDFDGWYTDAACTDDKAFDFATATMPGTALILYAKWTPTPYTLTLHLEGGTGDYGVTPAADGTVSLPYNVTTLPSNLPQPTKTGYTFGGWTPKEGGSPVQNIVITRDTLGNYEYTAIWNAAGGITYTVEHYREGLDGGGYTRDDSLTESLTGSTDATVTAVAKTIPGFTENTSYTDRVPSGQIKGDGSLVLKLYYQRNTYQVTFNRNYSATDTTEAAPKQECKFGATVTKPADPTRPGYTFAGWFTDRAGTPANSFHFDQTMEDKGNVTLYAKWAAASFSITYHLDGGTNAPGNPASYTPESPTITLDPPTKEGFIFLGWSETEDGTPVLSPAPSIETGSTDDKVFYAKWESKADAAVHLCETLIQAVKDKVPATNSTLVDSDSGKPIATLSVGEPDGETQTVLVDIQQKDYKAAGMLSLPFLTELFAYRDIQNLTFPAMTGAEATCDKNPKEIMSRVAYVALRESESQTFSNYVQSLMSQVNTLTIGVLNGKTVETVLNAHSDEKDVDYKVTYRLTFVNSTQTLTYQEDGAEDHSVELAAGAAIPAYAPTTTKTGYTADGWVLASDPTTPLGETMPAHDVVVVPNWKPNTYTVTLDSQGGTLADGSTSLTVTYDGTYSGLPSPTRAGYSFDGWFTEATGGTEVKTTDTVAITTDTTLYAHWTAGGYTLTYELDGGTLATANPTGYSIETETFTLHNPTKTGYTFKGWTWGQETTPVETATISKGTTGDRTYTAHWQINQYTITFDTDGGSAVAAITLDYGKPVTAPAAPTKTGATFQGWSPDVPTTMPAEDITVKAQWITNSHQLIYQVDGKPIQTTPVAFGEKLTLMEKPTKKGYTFDWVDPLPETMPDKDVTINGKYTPHTYTITFDANGGTGTTLAPLSMTYDQPQALPANANQYTKVGYDFAGWNAAPDGSGQAYADQAEVSNLTATNGGTVPLYAQWKPKTFTVSFDTGADAIKVTYGGTYGNLPEPKRDGWDFVGWYDGETPVTASTSVTITADQTLTAHWNAKGNTPYKVQHLQQNLEDDGYTLVATDSLTGQTDSQVQATPKDYAGFKVNATKSVQSGTVAGDGLLVLTLYYDRTVHTITWVTTDAASPSATQSTTQNYRYGATPDFTPATTVEKTDALYTFTGWNTAPQTVTGEATYIAQYRTSHDAAFCNSAGEVTATYRTLALALQHAQPGTIVRLEADASLTESATVPADVVLLIPCKDADSGYITQSGFLFNPNGTNANGEEQLYRTLTIPTGVTLTVNGAVMVNAITGRPATGHRDQNISGGYGQIALDGSVVVAAGGSLDAFGYVRGAGTVTAQNGGSLGDLYVVRNWRGGSQAFEMYQKGIYPMNEYDCHNIQTTLQIQAGGSLTGLVKMYASDAYYYTRFPQVNRANGLIRLHDGASLTRTYDSSSQRSTFIMNGGADFASSTLNIVGMDLSTGDYLYPVDGDLSFQLNNGDYTFQNKFKFLTGSSVSAANGATVTVQPGTTVVFYDQFNDVANTDHTEYPSRDMAVLTLSADAKFVNGGTFAGMIHTAGDNITIGAQPNWNASAYEANGYYADAENKGEKIFRKLDFQLQIERPNYTWSFNDDKSILWNGADYTKANAAIARIPDSLNLYTEETAQAVQDAKDAILFGLGNDRQADIDAWTTTLETAIANLVLRQIPITVTLDPMSGSVTPTTLSMTFPQTYGELPVPTRAGYVFYGWATAKTPDQETSGAIVTAETRVAPNDHILYAQWTQLQPADYTAVTQAIASIPSDLSLYTDATAQAVQAAKDAVVYDLYSTQQQQVDAYAQAIQDAVTALQLKTVVVTFDANAGTVATTTKTVTVSRPYGDLPTPTRPNYIFVGWFTAAQDGTPVTSASVVTSLVNHTLYAQWRVPTDADYSAVNHAIAAIPADLTPYTDASVKAVQDAKNAVQTGLDETHQSEVNAWAQAIQDAVKALQFKTVTVTLDAASGSVSPSSKTVSVSQAYGDLPTPTRSGYTFVGWFTAAQSGSQVTAASLVSTATNHTLYAHWTSNGSSSGGSSGGGGGGGGSSGGGGGGGSSGGGGGGGGGGSSATPSKTPSTTPSSSTPSTTPTTTVTHSSAAAEGSDVSLSVAMTSDSHKTVATVDTNTAEKLIADTIKNNSNNVAVTVPSTTDTVSLSLPTSAAKELATETHASLSVNTPLANITISKESVAQFANSSSEADTVAISMQKTGDALTVKFEAGGQSIDQLAGTAKAEIAVENTANAGTVAVLVAADGTETVIKKSVVGDKSITVPLHGSATIKIKDNSKHFVDTVNHWADQAIQFTASRELFNGVSEDTFAPNAPMTRGMLVTVLHRLEDTPSEQATSFPDVNQNTWYAEAVTWAAANGIVTGTPEGNFNPNGQITREQLATMLYRYANKLGMQAAGSTGDLSRFSDTQQVSGYAQDAMAWAVSTGIVTGKTGGRLDPAGQATRAEVSTMLMRLVDKMNT